MTIFWQHSSEDAQKQQTVLNEIDKLELFILECEHLLIGSWAIVSGKSNHHAEANNADVSKSETVTESHSAPSNKNNQGIFTVINANSIDH